MISRIALVFPLLCLHFGLASSPGVYGGGKEPASVRKYRPKLADFRLDGDQIIPEIDSSHAPVFGGSISAIPQGYGVDRFTAPPFTVVMRQMIGVRDERTGATFFDGMPSGRFRRLSKKTSAWEPGSWTTETQGWPFSIRTKIVALSRHQGYAISVAIRNRSKTIGHFDVASVQQPGIAIPTEWNWNAAFKRDVFSPVVRQAKDTVVHGSSSGAVAIASREASIRSFGTLAEAREAFISGSRRDQVAPGTPRNVTLLSARLTVAPGGEAIVSIVVVAANEEDKALREAHELAANPDKTISQARNDAQLSLERWFQRLPAVTSSSPELLKFYRHAAAQLLYDRWTVGKTFLLDPWYPTSGLDSGTMNTYAWDIQYAALAFALLDPHSFRKLLTALPAAPLTEHYSIEPVHGKGIGTYYAYNSYAYINSVDQYLSVTGDRSLLQEEVQGKTVLEWMITLAEWGEKDKDSDGNGLLDYGDDHNLLELKKTGNGPGYSNEVPSPNGERVYTYRAVADLMEESDPQLYREKILHFREMANKVADALNSILWLEKEGWYGTRPKRRIGGANLFDSSVRSAPYRRTSPGDTSEKTDGASEPRRVCGFLGYTFHVHQRSPLRLQRSRLGRCNELCGRWTPVECGSFHGRVYTGRMADARKDPLVAGPHGCLSPGNCK